MINVWHVRKAPRDAQYIGREFGGYPRSPFCNPQNLGARDRDSALIDFAIYWFAPEQAHLRRRAMSLPQDIMCWCAPRWCHGHIIAGYIEWRMPYAEVQALVDMKDEDIDTSDIPEWTKDWKPTQRLYRLETPEIPDLKSEEEKQ